jgi:hypothetical protein
MGLFRAVPHLRDYLKPLPNFDDVEVEDRDLNWVTQHPSFHEALTGLVCWPVLPRVACLVESRCHEIDGDRYDILNPVAEAIQGNDPLAASLLGRALITYALKAAWSSRRHLSLSE